VKNKRRERRRRRRVFGVLGGNGKGEGGKRVVIFEPPAD
jgi:hypothetical protein